MTSDWSGCIHFKAKEAKAGYVVGGSNSDGTGFLEISGDASLSRLSGTEEVRQDFQLSLTIRGTPAAQVKAGASVWPRLFDEIASNDDVIGIVLKADEYKHRRAEAFVSALQFNGLKNSLSTGTAITLYCRESAISESDLIVSVHFYTTIIAPHED